MRLPGLESDLLDPSSITATLSLLIIFGYRQYSISSTILLPVNSAISIQPPRHQQPQQPPQPQLSTLIYNPQLYILLQPQLHNPNLHHAQLPPPRSTSPLARPASLRPSPSSAQVGESTQPYFHRFHHLATATQLWEHTTLHKHTQTNHHCCVGSAH